MSIQSFPYIGNAYCNWDNIEKIVVIEAEDKPKHKHTRPSLDTTESFCTTTTSVRAIHDLHYYQISDTWDPQGRYYKIEPPQTFLQFLWQEFWDFLNPTK